MNFLKINPLLKEETFEVFGKLLTGIATHGFSYYNLLQFVHGPVVYTISQTNDDEWILTSHRRCDKDFDVYNVDFPSEFRITKLYSVGEPVDVVNLWDEFIEILIEDNEV